MKKTAMLIILILMLICITSCGTPVEEEKLPLAPDTTAVETTFAETEPEKPIPVVEEDVNPDSISVMSIDGLNERIRLQLEKPAKTEKEFVPEDFKVSYRPMDEAEFTELDKELYLEENGNVACYILGLPEGKYCVKIEYGDGDTYARTTLLDIDVERQDRSGYAHFQNEEGIGGYNNDGSVKENAVILYVNTANKNTVTLDINGTTYTGLVAILQAKQYMEEPLIIRVTGKIATNQWKARNSEVRLADGSNWDEDYFNNELATRYKENLAGLEIQITDGCEGKKYTYVTTPTGMEEVKTEDIGQQIVTYEDGTKVYSDVVATNTLYIENAKNLTIEGVGPNAEFAQFGFRFMFCDSIEFSNLTMSSQPYTAFGVQSMSESDPNPHRYIKCSGYWVHNNTFKIGQNAWSVGIEKYGDETLDFYLTENITVSYNMFDNVYKGMLIGTWEKDLLQDVTLHHNYYCGGIQRFPLTRGANIHSYNNVYRGCGGASVREVTSNFFSESNWFIGGTSYYASDPNLIKSWNDVFIAYPELPYTIDASYVVVTDREQVLENNQCSPDKKTDFSAFDTNPELFYYDAENKCTVVDLMLDTSAMGPEEIFEWMGTYVGAGKYVRLELDGESAE